MTHTVGLVRRPLWQILIAFVLANSCVVAFALHADQETWLLFWAFFLALELPAAASREPGDTMSECWQLWVGWPIAGHPARPKRLAFRAGSVIGFALVLGPHLALRYPGGAAVIVSSLPMVVAIGHSYWLTRRHAQQPAAGV